MQDTIIKDEDVKWVMKWNTNNHPNKPPTEIIFEAEKGLARLLAAGIIFLNNHWWEEEWPAEAKKTTSLNVNCNDVFAWGCADGEEVYYDELEDLYNHWEKDPEWGSTVWCCKKRNELPQKPVYDRILAAGVWDLDSMGLEPNYYDAAMEKRRASL